MLALPTVVWAGVLFGIVVYLGTMQLEEDSDAGPSVCKDISIR